MDPTVSKIIAALLDAQREQAEAGMKFPKSEPFEHGVQVGIYRGFGKTLDIIENILADRSEQESKT